MGGRDGVLGSVAAVTTGYGKGWYQHYPVVAKRTHGGCFQPIFSAAGRGLTACSSLKFELLHCSEDRLAG
jgi:hypothetical protein